MVELTNKEKQKIRDGIDRLKHLKEPYIIWLQVLVSVGVVLFIFMLGNVDSQLDKLRVTNNYTINLIENYTINASPKTSGTIYPNQGLNITALRALLNNIWVVFYLIFIFFIGAILYGVKYVRYDQHINQMYNMLVGLKSTKKVKESLINRFFKRWVKVDNTSISSKDMKSKKETKKSDLESLFEEHQYTLIVLSIFLLITIEFVGKVGYLNNLMALLSALIAYFLLIGIEMPSDKNMQTFPSFGFSIIFPIFIVTFCTWAILNIVIILTGEKSKLVWVLVWLGLMLYPIIKSFFKKK